MSFLLLFMRQSQAVQSVFFLHMLVVLEFQVVFGLEDFMVPRELQNCDNTKIKGAKIA